MMLTKYSEYVGTEENTQAIVNSLCFTISSPVPCPAVDMVSFTIDMSYCSNVDMQVFDLNGRLIDNIYSGQLAQGSSILSWDCSEQPPGVYLLSTQVSGNVLNNRMIVSR